MGGSHSIQSYLGSLYTEDVSGIQVIQE